MTKSASKLPIQTDKASPAKENFWSLEGLHQEVDRLFDDFRSANWHLPFRRPSRGMEINWPAGSSWQVAPAMDLIEKDGEYEITAELAGMDEKDIEIKLANNILTIKGEKSEEKKEEQKDYFLSERRYGSFQRSFRLPDGVDADKIEAKFAKGLLTVKLPKSAETKKAEKKIGIKAG
ncbi:MAG: Hsp20/alpha crystallin family protein [Flavobacteriaceae bacterium]